MVKVIPVVVVVVAAAARAAISIVISIALVFLVAFLKREDAVCTTFAAHANTAVAFLPLHFHLLLPILVTVTVPVVCMAVENVNEARDGDERMVEAVYRAISVRPPQHAAALRPKLRRRGQRGATLAELLRLLRLATRSPSPSPPLLLRVLRLL